MTNELEKQFFDTFGIEPKLTFYDLIRLKEDTNQEFGGRCNANWQGETKEETVRRFSPKGWKVLECKDVYTYPVITDRILLELICIHNTYLETNLYSLEYESLKEEILKDLINEQESRELKKDYVSDDMNHQVRTLFEEGQE